MSTILDHPFLFAFTLLVLAGIVRDLIDVWRLK